jgi:hypothetical protein
MQFRNFAANHPESCGQATDHAITSPDRPSTFPIVRPWTRIENITTV